VNKDEYILVGRTVRLVSAESVISWQSSARYEEVSPRSDLKTV